MKFKYKDKETPDLSEYLIQGSSQCGCGKVRSLQIGYMASRDYGEISFVMKHEGLEDEELAKWKFDTFKETLAVMCQLEKQLKELTIEVKLEE